MQVAESKNPLDKVSFLVGDWVGNGTLDYPGPPVRTASYNILSMIKKSPSNNQLLVVTFNDDPKKGEMFHATQSFIFVDRGSGQLRVKRHWLMESDSSGFITVERISEKENSKELGFTVVGREGVPDDFQHDGTIEPVSPDEFLVKGEVRVNNKSYPYRDKYIRRAKSGT